MGNTWVGVLFVGALEGLYREQALGTFLNEDDSVAQASYVILVE